MRGWTLTVAALVGAAAFVLFITRRAEAQVSSMSVTQLLRILNGTPVHAGVLTSLDGGLVTAAVDANTAYMVLCQPGTTGHVNVATTCSNSYTSATFCPPINGETATYFVTGGAAATSLSMFPSDAGVQSCPYFKMQ